jgi:hypothetical protein
VGLVLRMNWVSYFAYLKILHAAFTLLGGNTSVRFALTHTENIKLVFCAVKDTILQNALKEFNLA